MIFFFFFKLQWCTSKSQLIFKKFLHGKDTKCEPRQINTKNKKIHYNLRHSSVLSNSVRPAIKLSWPFGYMYVCRPYKYFSYLGLLNIGICLILHTGSLQCMFREQFTLHAEYIYMYVNLSIDIFKMIQAI